MINILYKNLHDELIDRLDSFVGSGPQREFVRIKKESEVELARAATQGVIHLLRTISYTGVPDLVQTLELTERNKRDEIRSFSFPPLSLHEREDGGIVSFIVDGEELDPNNSVPYNQLLHYTRSRLYSEFDFNIDIAKRTFFTNCTDKVYAIVLRQPHSVFAAESLMYAGASIDLTVNTAADGTVTITDGIGGSVAVPVLAADTVNQKLLKIVDAVNAAVGFAYNAIFNDPVVQLFHRYDEVSPNQKLKPQVVSGGTGTYVVTDTGTYELPVPEYYFNDLASLAFSALLDVNVEAPSRQRTPEPEA